jgi:leader peptidase (prepilin peptidase)/N-methyltransferase
MSIVAEIDSVSTRALSRARMHVLVVIGAAVGSALVAATLLHFGLRGQGAAWAAAQLLLCFLAVFDVATRRVPNRVTLPAAAAALILRAVLAPSSLVEAVAAGATAFAVFLVIAVLTRGGLGMGDVKLAGLLGLLLGRAVLPALLIGVILGGVASAAVFVMRRNGRGRTIAYAPYLCLGGSVAILALGPPPLV